MTKCRLELNLGIRRSIYTCSNAEVNSISTGRVLITYWCLREKKNINLDFEVFIENAIHLQNSGWIVQL